MILLTLRLRPDQFYFDLSLTDQGSKICSIFWILLFGLSVIDNPFIFCPGLYESHSPFHGANLSRCNLYLGHQVGISDSL